MLPIPIQPKYDFKHPVFRKYRKLIKYASDHEQLFKLWRRSDVISYEVVETVSELKIPVVYIVHYKFRTITGIDDSSNPIYGNHHHLELSLKNNYPIESPTAYMVNNIWHPNVKSSGERKGRVCVNGRGNGIAISLDLIVIRIAEILQYKNYLAEFIPPYPEDETVAKWVREVAEPKGIVNNKKGIYVDETPLLRLDGSMKDIPTKKPVLKIKPRIPKIQKPKTPSAPRSKIIIGKKNSE